MSQMTMQRQREAKGKEPAKVALTPAPLANTHRMMESPNLKRDSYGNPPQVIPFRPRIMMIVDDERRYDAAQRAGAEKYNERMNREKNRLNRYQETV